MSGAEVGYDRERLVEVLIYHWRRSDSGCGCGWHELGRSWPEHVVTIYEEAMCTMPDRACRRMTTGENHGS